MTSTIFIHTSVGKIAVHHRNKEAVATPLFLLHGVYFDHCLWEAQIDQLTDRPVYAIDMPLHGESRCEIIKYWTLNDCAKMLIEILDYLKLDKVIAVGHSWGSMTILRATAKNPDLFAAIGLCNMPFKAASSKEKLTIRLQHSAIIFRKLYMHQAAKALMGKDSLKDNPGLIDKLKRPMSVLNNSQIIYTDKAVRIDAEDTTDLILGLKVPVKALSGKSDYVGLPPLPDVNVVKGGHVSPLEAPEEVNNLIAELIRLSSK